MTKLLKIFDGQWRQAYQRTGDNTVKLKEHDIRALGIETEPKADDEAVRSDRRPTTKSTSAAMPAKKKAKPRPETLRRSIKHRSER